MLQPDGPPPPVFDVLTEVGIINQLTTAALEACLPEGLIAAHFAVLNHLIRLGDGQTPIKMAQALQVPKTSFSNTLATLNKRGLIQARPNPQDRRSKTIWITPDGRKVIDSAVAQLTPVMQDLAQRCAPGTFQSLLPHLGTLRATLDAMRDDD